MKKERPVSALLLVAGVALYATLAVTSMRLKSSVFDECAHVPAGYTYLRFGDFRLNPEHPPLVKLLAAAPLLFMDVEARTDDHFWRRRRQWEFGQRFLYEWNDADRVLFRARLPIVALGAMVAGGVFFWARRHWGIPAAALALMLCVLNPDMLAHGQIVTTDMGIALFILLSVAAFERLTQRATWPRLILAGLSVGAAFATKFSAVVLVPVLLALGLVAVASREPMLTALRAPRAPAQPIATPRGRAIHVLTLLAAVAALSLVVVWSSYGFKRRISPEPAISDAHDWNAIRPQGRLWDSLAIMTRRSAILPDPYLFGFLRFYKHSERRKAFLMGELSEEGWWYYFPATFLLKTPLPLLLLVATALFLTVRDLHARRGSWRSEAFLWLPAFIYFAIVMTRNLNIGHRHLLPVYPFLFVAVGRCATLPWPASRAVRSGWGVAGAVFVALCALWYAREALFIHPHYLAYFNQLGGGPRNGYKLLVDSNLDWGQDLKGLKAYMDRSRIARIKLSYFGSAQPSYYGIQGDRLPGFLTPDQLGEVQPGDLLAVSATNVQGVYLDPEHRGLARKLRRQRPIDMVGYSILIYRADFTWSP